MKNRIRAVVLGATMLCAGASAAAVAQQMPSAAGVVPPAPGGEMRGGGLMRADANHDGIVTRDEVIADADRRFAAMDTDGDGKLSREEMRAARQARRASGKAEGRSDRIRPASTTGEPHRRDGVRPPFTQQAFRDRALNMFDRADANHDGRVDAQEMQAMRLLIRARMSGGGHGEGAPPSDEQQ